MKNFAYFIGGVLLLALVVNQFTTPATTTQASDEKTAVTLPVFNPPEALLVTLPVFDKQVKYLNLVEDQTVEIYGEINESSEAIAQKITSLAAKGKPIYLLINSPGGSVMDGALIISAIEASKAPVYTICTQLCASMAALIHQYGHTRYMVDRSILMFHPAAGGLMLKIAWGLSLQMVLLISILKS